MALDPDILAVTVPQEPTPQQIGLDPGIVAAAAPPAAPQAVTPPAPPSLLRRIATGAEREAAKLPPVTPLQQLLGIPAVRQFEKAGVQMGAEVPAESIARLVGLRKAPVEMPELATKAQQAGALLGGAGTFALTSLLGGEALDVPAVAAALRSLGLVGRGVQAATPLAIEAGTGAALSPGAPGRGAVLGVLGGQIGKGVATLAPEGASVREFLLGNVKPADIPQNVSAKVEGNYKTVKDNNKPFYEKAQNIADKAGFSILYNDLNTTSTAIQKAEEDFNLQPATSRALNKLKDLMQTKKSADFGEIHNQIMDLGQKSSSAYKPGTFEDSQALRMVKNSLMDDVRNRAEDMGAPKIAKALDAANLDYRNNVAPYHDRGVFGSIIKKTVPPDQIANILTKADHTKVLNDLNPETKNLLLHEKLKPAMKLTPQGKIDVDPGKLWDIFSVLKARNPALAERLITDEANKRMLNLGGKVESAIRAIPGVRRIPEVLRELPLIKQVGRSPLAIEALHAILPSAAVQAPALLEGGIR